MHSNIFEVSRTPVPVPMRARAGHMPDWFFEQVCDYAENPSPAQREKAVGRFYKQFGGLCTQSGDKISILPQIRTAHFHKSYNCFRAAAEALAQTDYDVFTGIVASPAFHLALNGLNDSYEDKRGIYIYLAESGELLTLDHWLRTADFSRPFYIGGTINYHC